MDGGAPSAEDRGPARGVESREKLIDAAVELVVEHYDADRSPSDGAPPSMSVLPSQG